MGLGDKVWKKTIGALDKTVKRYEKVNRIITFGYSDLMRRKLVDTIKFDDEIDVLDAGCGPGNLSRHILKKMKSGRLYCLDPLPSMLKAAFNNLRSIAGDVKLSFIEATFESIPLPDSSVDLVTASYSLRDAKDFYKALEEFKRVLRPGGVLLILDLAKPDNKFFSSIVGLYLKTLVPAISIPIYGSFNTPWKALYPTFKRMLAARELIEKIGEQFEIVKAKKVLLGTFVAIKARRL